MKTFLSLILTVSLVSTSALGGSIGTRVSNGVVYHWVNSNHVVLTPSVLPKPRVHYTQHDGYYTVGPQYYKVTGIEDMSKVKNYSGNSVVVYDKNGNRCTIPNSWDDIPSSL